ncbi:MAG: hypothetical protein NTV09_12885 [Bacteroidetes bacterium]|nr:hypothetical protein [Bacteroidota bacterium]
MIQGNRLYLLLVFLFAASIAVAQKSPASEADLKKQAEKLFEKQNYEEATPMYSQLLSLYSREAIYNYRYGICLLMSGRDKTGAATYLEVAAKAKETDPDVYYYLGRSYMFMDHYNEAINAFTVFKKNALSSKQNVLQPDIYIQNCKNADQLRRDRKNVVVLNKRKVNRTAFFASYDFSEAAGKLLTTPDRFLTPLDKEKMPNPVMFMTKDGETIYYASYGKKGENGKDIYRIIKLPDGSWSIPVNLSNAINTNANEDFPYLDKDGRTLYFCSNGINSIGGYDIFKSQYDFNTGKWSDPENVGVPINTVDDDIFFMPSTKGLTAAYSTAIDCESGKIEIRNVKLGDVVSNIAVISGKYFSQDQVTRRDARISVIRTKDNGIVTSVKTDRTGDYELIVPAGDEYMLIVEGGSYLPHAELFTIPAGSSTAGLKQRVSMNKNRDKEEMTMTNYFSPSTVDSSLVTMEKPSQVAKSEFDVKDTASSKMQAITFEGKTLYVAPPSLKSPESLAMEPVTYNNGQNTSRNEKENELTGELNSGGKPESETEAQNEPVISTGIANAEDKADTQETGSKLEEKSVSDKTSNADLVKMAFEDATAISEESVVLHESATEKLADAKSLDSLATIQLKQSNELLKEGNKENAEALSKDSKENALEARQLVKDADSIQTEANQRKTESEIAYQEASQLMKDFHVDTNAIASHSSTGKGKEKDKGNTSKTNAKKNSDSANDVATTGKQDNGTEISHYQKAKKLSEEADKLVLASEDMTRKAESAVDKSRKQYYQKKSNEFKKQGKIRKTEAEKETALALAANEMPLPATSETGISDNTQGTVAKAGDSAKPEENNTSEKAGMTEPAKIEGGKEEAGTITSLNTPVKEEGKTKDESLITADSKNASIKNEDQTLKNEPAATGNVSGEKSTKGNTSEQVISGNVEPGNKSSLNVDPTRKDAVVATPDAAGAMADNKKADSTTTMKSDDVLSVNSTKDNAKVNSGSDATLKTNDQNSSDQPSANNKEEISSKNVDKETANENAIPVASMESKESNIQRAPADPLALQHYENYQKYLADSKRTEAISKETEAKLFSPNSKQKRDSLEAKTAVLNKQSITEWQSAQKELELAKQIDPEIEQKADNSKFDKNEITAANEVANNSVPQSGNTAISKDETEKNANSEPTKEQQEQDETIAVLDTTRPEYPKYVETQKAIFQKQTETVSLFVEGMQLNKKVVAIKADEMKLRDQAEVTSVKKEKNKLLEKADSLAMEADIISNHSKEMLSMAQKNTGSVKELTAKSDQLKTKLIIAPAGTDVAMNPGSQSNKPEQSSSKTLKQNEKQNATEQGVGTANSNLDKDKIDSPETAGNNGRSDKQMPLAKKEPVGKSEKSETDTTEVAVEKNTPAQTEQTQGANTTVPLPIYPAATPAGSVQPSSSTTESKNTTENAGIAQSGSTVVPEIEISDAATFSFGKGDAYSAANPIPIDPVLPEGLVFKVQIGAFRKPLPDNTFKNLQPLSGETTRPGWIRYCLGLFRTFEPANLLKKEVRSMGYKDAFVVAYYNGKRIPLYDAYALISKANAEVKKIYSSVSEKEFNQLAKFEIRKSVAEIEQDADAKAFYGTTERISSDLVEYAVQVGVYRSARIPSALSTLLPLNTDQMKSGLFRFTTGRFDNRVSADSMKRIAITNGVKDAFVVIYKGGMKASAADILKIQSSSKTASKVVASSTITTAASGEIAVPNDNIGAGDVVFKVQIGAFKENVPMNTVTSFLEIADKGISRETDSRGLNIFYAGTYKNYNEVVAARAEIVSKGIKDAFIVAFVKGKRTSVTEALKDLNGK